MMQMTSSTSGTKEHCQSWISQAQSMYQYVTYQLTPVNAEKNQWQASITYQVEDTDARR